LGVAGRDGATLAVEQANAKGGVLGRQLVLQSFDDQQNPEKAREIMKTLAAAGHKVLIGPMISSIGVEMVPMANQAGILIVSPTVTTAALSGLDDQFFRVISSTSIYAQKSAEFHTARMNMRRYAIVRDEPNKAYTGNWTDQFIKTAQANGAQLVSNDSYTFKPDMSFAPIAQKALQGRPDTVVVIASAVDTAQVARAVRKLSPTTRLITAEWAATEQFISLGGNALEGVHVGQFHDRNSTAPEYLAFVAAFAKRFGRNPGFAELAAYDAARVVLKTLSAQQNNESLKATLLRLRSFEGVQQPVVFDEFGDSTRQTYITAIKNGRFEAIQ
jgi:branched-chain amino acid transport system substrate-binding protein